MKNKISLKVLFLVSLFVFLATAFVNGQEPNELITNYLKNEQQKNGWLPTDINDWIISDQYSDNTSDHTHIYIQQRHHDIVVYNAISNFLVKNNKILYFKSGIIDSLQYKVNADSPAIGAEDAINDALIYLGKPKTKKSTLRNHDTALNKFIYDSPDISNSPVNVQLVYRQDGKKFLLSWDVSIELKDEPHWWNIRINALTGKYIDKNDFTVQCSFDDFNIAGNREDDFSIIQPPPPPASTAVYNVFPYPIEAPSFGSRSLLPDPSDSIASPYGWHDVNGVTGAEYTITRGNNVYAYEDANNDNLPGYSPDGGVSLNFNFPFSSNVMPVTNQDASLTNLFYDNNTIHDFLYPLGFNEAAGNFQQNNYGNGGNGGDYVKAEGFDGSGTNNANFSTPSDGLSGRMQMYLWDGDPSSCTNLNVVSSTYTGPMTVGIASFSPNASVTANVILVNDGVGTVTDACSAITNNISGKIALIDRGTCNFIYKAQTAAAAGAVGVIIANNVSGAPPGMSGTPTISIPCVSVSLADGNTLKTALTNGIVSATINICVANQLDGSFDNGIVTHEFCHGVSNRLTGGPSQAGCLSNGEQGGEGWSDWLALIMTIEPGDQGSNARGLGTYVLSEPTTGPGIRRYPYSTDMNINPQTYGDLALNTEVHAIGEIWCDAIWDMSWSLIDLYGFSPSQYNTTAGNTIAIRLVLEGMKLQPCGPGFLDARDAILTADAILYNNAHRCLIWQAFARRGMGYNASEGSPNVAGDETEGFDLPPYCLPPTQVPVAVFNSSLSAVICGGSVQFTDQSTQAFNWHWDFGDQDTSDLQSPVHVFTSPGNYTVKLVVTNPLGSDSITHSVTVNSAFSVSVTASPTSVCVGDSVNLNAVASGSANRAYTVTSIPYAPLTGTGTAVSLADDQMSSVQPIGFTFNFFGQNYTNFYIASNGFITFSAGMPATPVYGELIPSEGNPNNIIALAWNDLNPQTPGSSITYFTTGVSPNRKLVVKYSTYHYGGTIYPFIVQAILYEGTNIIEIHTTTISDASSFDPDATTTQGIENTDGSTGVAVPGRNGMIFSASNDAYRFTPYVPYSFSWLPGNMNGSSQTVYPVTTTSYTVTVSDGTSCLVSFPAPTVNVSSGCVELNIGMFIEGFYLGNNKMINTLFLNGLSSDSTACDSIIVELHDPVQTDSVLYSVKTILHTNGQARVYFPNAILNLSYFIVVKHRNSIETWSSSPITISSGTTYNFFTAASQAYGNNLVDVGTPNSEPAKWAVYSGDISDAILGLGYQDGIIESQDYSDMQNAVFFTLIGYKTEDITGDGFVESADYSLMENNVYFTILVIRP